MGRLPDISEALGMYISASVWSIVDSRRKRKGQLVEDDRTVLSAHDRRLSSCVEYINRSRFLLLRLPVSIYSELIRGLLARGWLEEALWIYHFLQEVKYGKDVALMNRILKGCLSMDLDVSRNIDDRAPHRTRYQEAIDGMDIFALDEGIERTSGGQTKKKTMIGERGKDEETQKEEKTKAEKGIWEKQEDGQGGRASKLRFRRGISFLRHVLKHTVRPNSKTLSLILAAGLHAQFGG